MTQDFGTLDFSHSTSIKLLHIVEPNFGISISDLISIVKLEERRRTGSNEWREFSNLYIAVYKLRYMLLER